MPAPTHTIKAARTAARRMMVQRFVRNAGVAHSIGLGAVTVGVLADRLVGPGLDQRLWWWGIGASAFLASAWSAASAWRRRPSDLEAAIRTDHRLGLRDALSTGLDLHERADPGDRPDVFADMAIQDAESAAQTAALTRATPIRFDNWWAVWPGVVISAVALTFVQPLDLLTDHRTKIEAAERVADVRSAEQALDEAAKALEEIAESGAHETRDAPSPEAHAERMQALDRLREQLASGAKSSDDARAEAASELTKAADAAAQQAQQAADAQQSVARAMSALKPEALGAEDSPARRLAEALQAADADSAKQTAGEISKSLTELSETQRRQEARRLAELAGQLQELADQKQREAEAPRHTQDELTRQGLSEPEAKSLAERDDARSAEQELRDRGFDEDTAHRLADKLAAERAVRKSREMAAEELRQTADAIKNAQEELQQPPPPSPPRAPDSTPPKPSAPQNPAGEAPNKPEDGPTPKPPETSLTPGDPPSPQPRKPDSEPAGQKPPPTTPADPNASKGLQRGQPEEQPRKGESPAPVENQTGPRNPAGEPTSPDSKGQPPLSPDKPNQPDSTSVPRRGNPDTSPPKGQQPAQTPDSRPPESVDAPKNGSPGADQTPQSVRPPPPDQKSPSTGGDQPTPTDLGEKQPTAGDGAGNEDRESGIQSLQEQLDRMAKSPSESRRKMAESRKLRDQARRMLESVSPERRRELERLTASRQSENTTPGALEGVTSAPADFRTSEHAGESGEREVLAEFNDPNAPSDRSAAPGTRQMLPSAQQTLKGVQKAIEEKHLPARYRNVEKYFKRAVERENQPARAPQAEPVKDASDVSKPVGNV